MATAILSDFQNKVQPIRFSLKDNLGVNFHLQADIYLLNDILNKDKFFVAMKFTDLVRKVWIRTRVSMKTQNIYENINPILREWILVEKAIESSLPMVSLQVDKLRLLFKYRQGADLPTSIHLTPQEEYTVELIIAKVLYFFQHKFCLAQKISGRYLSVQNSAMKKLASLNTYFHSKHASKLPSLWKDIIKQPPVPWALLQKLNKKFVKDNELQPVGIKFGPMFDPLEPRINPPTGMEVIDQEFGQSSRGMIFMDNDSEFFSSPLITPSARVDEDRYPMPLRNTCKTVKRLSIPSTAKAYIRLRQVQRTYHGWQSNKFNVQDSVLKIRSHLITICLKINGLFWLNTVAIDVKDSKETSDDIIEDFEVQLIQVHFPLRTDKKWIGQGNINDMPKALNMQRKALLTFIGSRLGGTRVFQSQLDKTKAQMIDFIGIT